MQIVKKAAIKHISHSLLEGIKESELIAHLQNLSFPLSWTPANLIPLLDTSTDIYSKSNSKTHEKVYYSSASRCSYENDFFLLDSEITDKETQNAIQILLNYIIKSREKGISYSAMATKFQAETKKKIDQRTISHYCRKLFNLRLITIRQSMSFNLATYIKFAPKETLPEIFEKIEKNECAMPFSKPPEISYFPQLSFTENILIKLPSRQGLSVNELAQSLQKLHEKKMLNKLLARLDSMGVQAISCREGKTFLLKYRWFPPEISHSEYLNSEEKIEQTDITQNSNSSAVITSQNTIISKDNVALIKHNPLLNCSSQDLHSQRSWHLDSDEFFKLDAENQNFLSSLKLSNIIQSHLPFKPTQAEISNNENHTEIGKGELMLKEIIERVEFESIKQVNSKYSFLKRQVSTLKLNRYILTMNHIREKLVVPIFKLRRFIIEVMVPKGQGKIDRKTVVFMLLTLQKIGFVKLIHRNLGAAFEVGAKGRGKTIHANIVIFHELDENDIRIEEEVQEVASMGRLNVVKLATVDSKKNLKKRTLNTDEYSESSFRRSVKAETSVYGGRSITGESVKLDSLELYGDPTKKIKFEYQVVTDIEHKAKAFHKAFAYFEKCFLFKGRGLSFKILKSNTFSKAAEIFDSFPLLATLNKFLQIENLNTTNLSINLRQIGITNSGPVSKFALRLKYILIKYPRGSISFLQRKLAFCSYLMPLISLMRKRGIIRLKSRIGDGCEAWKLKDYSNLYYELIMRMLE